MVASSPPEPSANDYAALALRLDAMQRQLDEAGRAAKSPFVVSHNGVQDFAITPSPTGDGTMDILIGDGAGGKLIQVKTDPLYGTKIITFLDQAGKSMMSTDALAGFGWGTPSYPYLFGGTEEANLAANTSHATAVTIATGVAYAYNPAVYIQPRCRARTSTGGTIRYFAQFRHEDGSTYDSAEVSDAIGVGAVSTTFPEFAGQWTANDMNRPTAVFIKAYSAVGTAANLFVQSYYQAGYGISQAGYNLSGVAK